jgi:hypothetical protein
MEPRSLRAVSKPYIAGPFEQAFLWKFPGIRGKALLARDSLSYGTALRGREVSWI